MAAARMRYHATYSRTFSGLICKFACALSPDAQDDINQRRARLAASGTRRRDPWGFITRGEGGRAWDSKNQLWKVNLSTLVNLCFPLSRILIKFWSDIICYSGLRDKKRERPNASPHIGDASLSPLVCDMSNSPDRRRSR